MKTYTIAQIDAAKALFTWDISPPVDLGHTLVPKHRSPDVTLGKIPGVLKPRCHTQDRIWSKTWWGVEVWVCLGVDKSGTVSQPLPQVRGTCR